MAFSLEHEDVQLTIALLHYSDLCEIYMLERLFTSSSQPRLNILYDYIAYARRSHLPLSYRLTDMIRDNM